MHPNPVYHDADTAKNIAFARDRSFGVLAANGSDGPLISHVPFLLNEAGDQADLHLVRSNPIARALKSALPVKLAISGGDSYVSPDWYDIDDQVPTWNYVAVHLRGTLEKRPADVLPGMLTFQSYAFESRIKGKTPWAPDKMTPEVFEKMQRAIVPIRLHVESVDGTWKLGQNKPPPARLSAAAKLKKGFGQELKVLSALMRRPDLD